MDDLSRLTKDELSDWLKAHQVPEDVIKQFRAHEMDGEALVTLIGVTPGPDCLKDLISKVGIRLKVYNHIKSVYQTSSGSKGYFQDDLGCPGSSNSSTSSIKELSTSQASSGYRIPSDIVQLQDEISRLRRERDALQTEIDTLPVIQQDTSVNSEGSSNASSSSVKKSTKPNAPVVISNQAGCKRKQVCIPSGLQHKQELPKPFKIPTFRSSTEQNLSEEIPVSDVDRKYMVKTLATVLMTYVSRPSLKQCLVVSKALHEKFPFINDEGSEDAWKWLIYTRTQNINREAAASGPPKKKIKDQQQKNKHHYPQIPPSADDDISNERNLDLLKQEAAKSKPSSQTLKSLMARTCAMRRSAILNGNYASVLNILEDYPMLKRSSYAKLEFEQIMQRPSMKEEFDEDFLNWAKAVILYAQRSCTKFTAVQSIVKNVDVECDEQLLTKAIRCLGLLLIYTKVKKTDGDIPFLMTFVPSDTPPSQAMQKGNNQPHVVVIQHDEYEQYFIAIEQTLMMQTTDMATAMFLMFGSHYIFNLHYHPKINDLMTFVQEKVAKIPSEGYHKLTSPVAITHIAGIASTYRSLNEEKDSNTSDSDSDS